MKWIRFVIFTLNLPLIFVTCDPVFAAKTSALESIKKIVSKYQNASGIEASVTKEVVLALLDETRVSEGNINLSKGKLRLEIKKPDPSLMVVDGKYIWVETPTPKELGGRPQVLKMATKNLAGESKAPVAALLGQSKAWDQFQVKSQKQDKQILTVVLQPKTAKATGDVVSMIIVVDVKQELINELSYKDDIDNSTKYIFSKTVFNKNGEDLKFKYVPPKNSEITEI